jgi:hypothetical protein
MSNQNDTVSVEERHTGFGGPTGVAIGSGSVLLAGLYLLISPWVLQPFDQLGVAASDVVTGIVLALLGFGCARSFHRLRAIAWIVPVIGAWVICVPWVTAHGGAAARTGLTGSSLSSAAWTGNVVAGAVVVAGGVLLTTSAWLKRRPAPPAR